MENYQTIHPEFHGPVVTLWLSRPEVHNALDQAMIREITSFFAEAEQMDDLRFVIIRGRGKSFCSGADLTWMKNAFDLNAEDNLKECLELSQMFSAIFESSKIVLAVVHGNVFGGGNGLVAVCDMACCLENSRFCLSETRIGIAAATITPYLLQKMKATDLKELIYPAKSFNGTDAVRYGLVNHSFPSTEAMDGWLNATIAQMLENGKLAQIASKRLINKFTFLQMSGEMEKIPELLANIRVSPEAQEGFKAFLEKRKPKW